MILILEGYGGCFEKTVENVTNPIVKKFRNIVENLSLPPIYSLSLTRSLKTHQETPS